MEFETGPETELAPIRQAHKCLIRKLFDLKLLNSAEWWLITAKKYWNVIEMRKKKGIIQYFIISWLIPNYTVPSPK